MSAKVITVEREVNGTKYSYPFELAKLKAKTGEEAKTAYVPVKPKTSEDEQNYFNFIGLKDAVGMIARVHRQFSVNWSGSASTKTGGQPMDSEVWVSTFSKLASEMSAEGSSMKALRAEATELKAELFQILGNKTMDTAVKLSEMERVGKRIQEIDAVLAARAAANAKEDEEEAEIDSSNGQSEEAKETAAVPA